MNQKYRNVRNNGVSDKLFFNVAIRIPEGDDHKNFKAYIVDIKDVNKKSSFSKKEYNPELSEVRFQFYVPSSGRDKKYAILVENSSGDTKYMPVYPSDKGKSLQTGIFNNMQTMREAGRTIVSKTTQNYSASANSEKTKIGNTPTQDVSLKALRQIVKEELQPINDRIQKIESRIPQQVELKTLQQAIESLTERMDSSAQSASPVRLTQLSHRGAREPQRITPAAPPDNLRQIIKDELQQINTSVQQIELRIPQGAELKTLQQNLESLRGQMKTAIPLSKTEVESILDEKIPSYLDSKLGEILQEPLEHLEQLDSTIETKLGALLDDKIPAYLNDRIPSSLRQFEQTIRNTLGDVVDAKLPDFLDFDKLKQDVKAELGSAIYQQLEESFGQLDSIVENKLEAILDARISEYLDKKIPAFLDKFEQNAITNLECMVKNTLNDMVSAYFEQFKRGMEKSIINTLIVTNTQIINLFGEHLKSAGELISKQREEIEASTGEQLIELSARTLNFYGEVLKEAGTLINKEYFGEAYVTELQKQLADTRQQAKTISELLTGIIDKAVADFGLDVENFRSFQSKLNMILTEFENAGAVQEMPLKVDTISFKEYLEKSGDNRSLAEVYENYLEKTRQQYEIYFKQFAAGFKQAAANATNMDSHVADKLETFVTNSIVSFAYLLDDELRKKSHDLPVPPIEEALQKLFKVSGLAEIKVISKEDKYDATIHEPVRWVTDEEAPKDAIVKLVRRGFIYNGKVLRRARVVVRQ